MPYAIYLHALYGQPVERWLTSYDPEMGDAERTGVIGESEDAAEAMRFESPAEAFKLVMTQSKRLPYRPDGEPNRPLRAFTLEVRAVE